MASATLRWGSGRYLAATEVDLRCWELLVYIFIGSIIMHGFTLSYIAGGAIVLIGAAYCKCALAVLFEGLAGRGGRGRVLANIWVVTDIRGFSIGALEFVPSIEPPENMKGNGNDWGEQV